MRRAVARLTVAVGLTLAVATPGGMIDLLDQDVAPPLAAATGARTPAAPSPADELPPAGYWMFAKDGGVFAFGGAPFAGRVANQGNDVIGMATTPSGGGYWVADDDGDVFRAGDAPDFGSRPGDLDEVGAFAARPQGDGYWMATRTGAVEAYGGAPGLGGATVRRANRIVGLTATATGGGYWATGVDGGVFAFGDARFLGSMGGTRLNQPVVGMAATPSGGGYWLVAADGGIFAFGDAGFHGSMGSVALNQPVVGMASSPSGRGYWLVAADGGVFSFGDARFSGSMGGTRLNQPVAGILAAPGRAVLGIEAASGPGNAGDPGVPVAVPATPAPSGPAPETAINSGPAPVVDPGPAFFSLASNQGGVHFECSLDGGPFTTCGAGWTVTAAAAGSHTAAVRARNDAGAADPSPATWSWRVVPPATFVGAGDISSCANNDDEATAKLLDATVAADPATVVFTLGDLVYNSGSPTEFTNCYNPTWGRHKARTMPAVGNHEYGTANATGYYGYFAVLPRTVAGDPAKGYYSYDLGAWHVVVLNSNCDKVSCSAGGAQETWLRADLAASAARCTVAVWHHPRFNSGAAHGNSTGVSPFWTALYQAGADLVLAGHEHLYERFAPQTPAGQADGAFGLRHFTVGTGGKEPYNFGAVLPNSEKRSSGNPGVLKLTLRAGAYDWQFLPVAGKTFTDTGSASCHGKPGA